MPIKNHAEARPPKQKTERILTREQKLRIARAYACLATGTVLGGLAGYAIHSSDERSANRSSLAAVHAAQRCLKTEAQLEAVGPTGLVSLRNVSKAQLLDCGYQTEFDGRGISTDELKIDFKYARQGVIPLGSPVSLQATITRETHNAEKTTDYVSEVGYSALGALGGLTATVLSMAYAIERRDRRYLPLHGPAPQA